MNIITSTVTRRTHSARFDLSATQPDGGWPCYDGEAGREAKQVVERATKPLRDKVRNPNADIHWWIERQGAGLSVVAQVTEVIRQ